MGCRWTLVGSGTGRERRLLEIGKLVLTAALADVSGLGIKSRDQACDIPNALPQRVINRIWVLYKTGLPEKKFFLAKGLFRAPEPNLIVREFEAEDDLAGCCAQGHAAR
jgi:hypothetical protein